MMSLWARLPPARHCPHIFDEKAERESRRMPSREEWIEYVGDLRGRLEIKRAERRQFRIQICIGHPLPGWQSADITTHEVAMLDNGIASIEATIQRVISENGLPPRCLKAPDGRSGRPSRSSGACYIIPERCSTPCSAELPAGGSAFTAIRSSPRRMTKTCGIAPITALRQSTFI